MRIFTGSEENALAVLKPFPVWGIEQEQEEETAEMEDSSKLADLPKAESVGSDDPAEGNMAEQEEGSEGLEQPAEELGRSNER